MVSLFTRSACLKFFSKAAGMVLPLVLLFWYAANLWAERKLPFIESTLSAAIHRPVTVQSAHYNLFKGFLLDGVEVKQHGPMFSPVRIARVRILPAFQLFPVPLIRIHKVVFEKPLFSVHSRPEELFHSAAILKNLPADRKQIGALKIEMKLSSVEVHQGKISLLLPEKIGGRDFENVEFFAGQGLFKRNFLRLKGNIAGKPEAAFRIECDMRNNMPQALDSNLRVDFRHFTTAYLSRHLDSRLQPPGDELTASVQLKIKEGGRFEVRGRIAPPEIPEMRFSARGFWKGGKATFTDLSLKNGNMELKGKGEALLSKNSGRYQFLLFSPWLSFDKLKGFIRPLVPGAGRAQFSIAAEGDARRFDPSLDIVFEDCAFSALDEKIAVTKITGRLKLSKKSLEARDVWAFVNNVPIRINANVQLAEKPRFTFDASSFPGQMPSLRSRNPFNISFKGRGARLREGWSGYVRLDEDILSVGRHENVSTLSFRGLSSYGAEQPLADGWRKTRWTCRALRWRRQEVKGPEGPAFSFKQLFFLITADSRSLRAAVYDASFNGGNMRLKIGGRFAGPAWGIFASIQDVDVSRLLRYLKKDYPLTGRLSAKTFGKYTRRSSRYRTLFKVSDGLVGPSERLAYWAEQTGIEAFRKIRFQSLSGEAAYDKGEWQLKNFHLWSDTLRVAAEMKIAGKNMSGLLSAKFPASSIKDSSDLKWLLRFVGAGEWVDFDFKVAGHILFPRIQWLGGEFKKKVETRLAPWMKDELAKQIEKRLAMTQTEQNPERALGYTKQKTRM